MHIAIAGNIGSGKTTLTRLLAKHFKWEAHFEDVDTNPYLNSFYEDMQRWSFNLQIYFLNSRFRQILQIREGDKTVVQDRTIYEDAYIFAPNLHYMNLMTTRDFENYISLFELMSSLVTHLPPSHSDQGGRVLVHDRLGSLLVASSQCVQQLGKCPGIGHAFNMSCPQRPCQRRIRRAEPIDRSACGHAP